MQNSNIPGWDFLINDIGSMDRAIRSSKEKIYIDSADYFAACLVSGAGSISQTILEDEAVKKVAEKFLGNQRVAPRYTGGELGLGMSEPTK